MNELALFAGAGGGILGGQLLGWRTVCAVEWEPYPASVLCARQNDGFFEDKFPIWDDVQTFDGRPWRGLVDVVSGGFPCQDISVAGKGAGIEGERSGMWGEMARIICEVQPRFVFVENSPMLTSRGLGRVLGDLASMGFDAKWGVLGAADIGANHQRDRIWIVGKYMGNTDDYGQIAPEVRASLKQRSNDLKTRQIKTRQSQGSGEQHGQLANSECMGRKEGANEQGIDGDRQTSGFLGDSGAPQPSNVANSDSIHDALRGDSEDYAESMGERRVHLGRSFSDSGAGCEAVSGQSSADGEIANSDSFGLQGSTNEQKLEGKRINKLQVEQSRSSGEMGYTQGAGFTTCFVGQGEGQSWRASIGDSQWWQVEPPLGRVANGMADRVDRLKAIGNGQVPLCAATAWQILSKDFLERT
jgi:site-specific DNA-cytosine methylase